MIVVANPVIAARYDFCGYAGAIVPVRYTIYQGTWDGLQPVQLGPVQPLSGWTFFFTLKRNPNVPDSQADYQYDWTIPSDTTGMVIADIPAATSATLPTGPYRHDIKAIVVTGDPQEIVGGYYTHKAAAGLRLTP